MSREAIIFLRETLNIANLPVSVDVADSTNGQILILVVGSCATHIRYPNLNGLQVDLAWMIRGFEQNSFERGYQQTESTPSAPNAFKAGVWGQIFLVGFNIARYVGLDWARKLAPPGARFLDRVSGLVVGCVCGMALLLQPALQLALYSVAMRFQLARTSRFPLTAVDVAPEVFLV